MQKSDLGGKFHHFYNYKYTICDELKCFREPEDQFSKHTVSVYLKKTNQRMNVIEHIPDFWLR